MPISDVTLLRWALQFSGEANEQAVLSCALKVPGFREKAKRELGDYHFLDLRNRAMFYVLCSAPSDSPEDIVPAAHEVYHSLPPTVIRNRPFAAYFEGLLWAAPGGVGGDGHILALKEFERRDRIRLALLTALDALKRGATSGATLAVFQEASR